MAEVDVFQNGDRLDVHPGFSYLGTHDGHLIVASAAGTTYYSPHGTLRWDADGRARLPRHIALEAVATDAATDSMVESDWARGPESDAAVGTLPLVEPISEQGSIN